MKKLSNLGIALNRVELKSLVGGYDSLYKH